MISKINVIKSLEKMPEKFSVDELFEQLLLMEKIENGLRQSENDQTFSTEEARKKLEKWLV